MFSGNIATARLTLDDIDRAVRPRQTGGHQRGAAKGRFRHGRLAAVSMLTAVAGFAGYLVA